MAELISFEAAKRRAPDRARAEGRIRRELALPGPLSEAPHQTSIVRQRDERKFRTEGAPVLGMVLALVAAGGLALFASHLCGNHAFSDRSIIVSSGISPF